MHEMLDYDEPCFVISVAARIVGVRTQTLRYYERLGLVKPHRTGGNQRFFSRRDVDRLQRVKSFTELGVNLVGVEVVMLLLERLREVEAEVERLKADNERLERLVGQAQRE